MRGCAGQGPAALTLLVLGAGLSLGCVSPGTSRGSLSVEGQLLDASGEPLQGEVIELLLSRAYGTRERDLAAGQAMDFGSPKRLLQMTTDAEGRFEGELGEQAFAVDMWMFPPRGAVPAAPPPPALLIRLPEISGENYYACAEKGVCTVMRPNGTKIPIQDSRLVRGEVKVETASPANQGITTKTGIELIIRAD